MPITHAQTTEEFLAAVMAQRAKHGLVLSFHVPDHADLFTCYPKDEAQKAAWLERAAAKGWKVAQ